jgi:formylglycine-generating enzyme required for sulfatase activity
MKTKLQCFFIGLALLAVVHPALAQQRLSIVPAGNQALLFWPATATNYVLQSTTNLVSPNWGPVNDAVPVTINNTIIVIVSYTSPAMFFRLYYNTTAPAGMALIPAGAFTIGDTLDGEGDATPTNVVYVSAFYMDVDLVTSNEWQTVYTYAANHGYSFDDTGNGNASNQPVWLVDWYDMVKWCNARSQQAGLMPAYYTDTNLTQVYTNTDVDAVYVNWSANGYRLPTEAEWEKAARGGLSGQRFPWGDLISETNANYNSGGGYTYDLGPAGYNTNFDTQASGVYTSPVGFFAANGYGLYDMAGNVSERCWDWYAGPPYPTGSPYLGGTDPHGPASSPYGYRVFRGGNWAYGANYLRCAARFYQAPDYASSVIGFRCVRGL